jgi:hypothetical protein
MDDETVKNICLLFSVTFMCWAAFRWGHEVGFERGRVYDRRIREAVRDGIYPVPDQPDSTHLQN